MADRQEQPIKQHGDKLESESSTNNPIPGGGEHARSYGAHTGTDGMQHMKDESLAGTGTHGSATHRTALRQPPETQSRNGKQHRD